MDQTNCEPIGDRISSSDIDEIARIIQDHDKTQQNLDFMKKALSSLKFFSSIFQQLSIKSQYRLLKDLRYQYVSEYKPILCYGDCPLYFYIIIKGRAAKLIKGPPISSVLKKQTTKKNYKNTNFYSPNTHLTSDANQSENKITSIKDIIENIGTSDQAKHKFPTSFLNEVSCLLNKNIAMKHMHPNLRRDPGIREHIFKDWYNQSLNSKEPGPENTKRKYKVIKTDDQKIYVPLEHSDDYISILNFLSPDMIITQVLNAGDHFGEHTYLFGNVSKKEVVALEDCHLVMVGVRVFRETLKKHFERVYSWRNSTISNAPFFKDCSSYRMHILCRDWTHKTYPINTQIYKEGEAIERVYLIINGEVELSKLVDKQTEMTEIPKSPDEKLILKQTFCGLNTVWNQTFRKCTKRKLKVAVLGENQIFGEGEIIGPNLSNHRTTTATVVSDSLEVYELLAETLITIFSQNQLEANKLECSIKDHLRENLEKVDLLSHKQIDKQTSQLSINTQETHISHGLQQTEIEINNLIDMKQKYMNLRKDKNAYNFICKTVEEPPRTGEFNFIKKLSEIANKSNKDTKMKHTREDFTPKTSKFSSKLLDSPQKDTKILPEGKLFQTQDHPLPQNWTFFENGFKINSLSQKSPSPLPGFPSENLLNNKINDCENCSQYKKNENCSIIRTGFRSHSLKMLPSLNLQLIEKKISEKPIWLYSSISHRPKDSLFKSAPEAFSESKNVKSDVLKLNTAAFQSNFMRKSSLADPYPSPVFQDHQANKNSINMTPLRFHLHSIGAFTDRGRFQNVDDDKKNNRLDSKTDNSPISTIIEDLRSSAIFHKRMQRIIPRLNHSSMKFYHNVV